MVVTLHDSPQHPLNGGVRRRRRSGGDRGRRRRRSRPGDEPATTHQQVVHLREVLLRLVGDFGSFAVELPELLVDHGRQQQRAVRFGMQQQVEDLAAGQAEVLRLLRARDVDDPEPAPATASAGGSSESSSSSEDDDDDDDGGGDDGAGAGVGAEPGRRGRQGGRRPRSANRRVRRRRAGRMREQE